MEVLLGGASGLVAGVVGGFVAAILQITAKRMRNAVLIRRGEPGYKDVGLVPLYLPCGVLGIVAGLVATWLADGTWRTGALAGLVAPALLALLLVGNCIVQLRR